jgi:hypothetical protein
VYDVAGVTILLSQTVFSLLVAHVLTRTSEAVPLIGTDPPFLPAPTSLDSMLWGVSFLFDMQIDCQDSTERSDVISLLYNFAKQFVIIVHILYYIPLKKQSVNSFHHITLLNYVFYIHYKNKTFAFAILQFKPRYFNFHLTNFHFNQKAKRYYIMVI